MSQPPSEQSSLTRLVVVIACLALAGSFVAGVHYFVVDLPQQKNIQPPANSLCGGHYDEKGNLIGYTCCDEQGRPEICHTLHDEFVL